MLRSLLCVGVALLFCTNMAQAKEAKPKAVNGTIKSVDAKAGKITVTVKKGTDTEDKDFTVTDSTKFTVFKSDGTKDEPTKMADFFANSLVAADAKIKVTASSDGTVTEVVVGKASRPKKAHSCLLRILPLGLNRGSIDPKTVQNGTEGPHFPSCGISRRCGFLPTASLHCCRSMRP